jgi:hypothetical protein
VKASTPIVASTATDSGLSAAELAAMNGELPTAATTATTATTSGLSASELAAMNGELPTTATTTASTVADNPSLWGPNGEFLGNSTVTGATAGTGSMLRSILGTAGQVGTTLGAAGSAATNARVQQAELQQNQDKIQQEQDKLAQQAYLDQLQGANTDLAQKKFTLTAPQTRENSAVRGDILANAQDFSYGAPTMVGNLPVPTSSGGLRPSIFSPSTRALGSTISSQDLSAQQAGDQFAPLPTMPSLTPLTPLPGPTTSTNILNTAGTVGNVANILKNVSQYF